MQGEKKRQEEAPRGEYKPRMGQNRTLERGNTEMKKLVTGKTIVKKSKMKKGTRRAV